MRSSEPPPRRVFTFQMIKTVSVTATLGPRRRSLSLVSLGLWRALFPYCS